MIRIIRQSDEPKPALIAAFGLSDRQAEDILEIRLRQLARLEAIRIEQELTALRTERQQLDALLGSESAQRRQLVKEIEADARLYGDARRTLIQAAARTVADLRIAEEPVTVIVSEKGWVRARQGHGQNGPAQRPAGRIDDPADDDVQRSDRAAHDHRLHRPAGTELATRQLHPPDIVAEPRQAFARRRLQRGQTGGLADGRADIADPGAAAAGAAGLFQRTRVAARPALEGAQPGRQIGGVSGGQLGRIEVGLHP